MARKKKEKEEVIDNSNLRRGVGNIVESAYLDFGSYINLHRHMAEVRDGMKISYRRLIYAATKYQKGKNIPTTELIASVAAYHPHSLTGIEDLNANLVKSGVFSGNGSFGYTEIDGTVNPHAATRYTKNRLSDLYWEIIGDLIKEVPYEESPVGALEPSYIPLPIPLCLYLKNQVSGLGVGIRTNYPSFSPISLYQAYLNDDPMLLEPSVDLFIDKKNSELMRLWKTGKGRVIYSYKISRYTNPDSKTEGILFEGDTSIFTPSLKKFDKLVADGKVFLDDLTDINGPKLFVGRVPGARGISVDDIEEIARKTCYSSTTYQLNVTDSKTAFRIPLYDWLDCTYKNYIALVEQVCKKKIDKVRFDIAVQEALPIISDYIINKNPKATDKELMKMLGFSQEIVDSVMSKPISQLRKCKDNTERLKSLKTKLKDLLNFNPVKYTEEIIKKL